MNCKLQITVFIAILLPVLTVKGQSSKGKTIQGKVLNAATYKGAALVTVRLQSEARKILKTAVTDSNGMYLLTNITSGQYYLTFSALSYKSAEISWKYNESISENIEPATVLLEQGEMKLKEIAVSADKPIVRQKAGKIIYDIQADPESRTTSVFNIMRKIPFVSMDGNNNLLLKGNADFRVFLNGKPSGMLERDLKTFLSNMPASTIQSIEVYTIPPARFDAEGAGGIINIITIRNFNNELKGNLNINEHWPSGGPGAGTSVTFKKNKLGVTAFAGASINKTPETKSTNERTTYGDVYTKLNQSGKDRSNAHSGYLGTELSYELDSLDLLTARLNIYDNKTRSYSKMESVMDKDGRLLQRYHSENESNNSNAGLDVAADYQRAGKKDKSRLMTLSFRHINSSIQPQTKVLISDGVGYEGADFQQTNEQQTAENTVQIDYVYPANSLIIEGGLKGIFRSNSSDYNYYVRNSETKLFELMPEYSDVFNYRQMVLAAYNSYSYSLKTWSLQGGVRVEKTIIDADFVKGSSKVEQDYVNGFPSLAVNKAFRNEQNLNFGFTQRMKRPGINRLNPFIDRQNPDFVSTGNPDLKPVIVNSVSAGYNIPGKMNFGTGLDYSFIHKLYLPVSQFDTATKITTTSFSNSGSVDAVSLYVNAGYKFTKRLNVSTNGNIMYFWLKGMVGDQEMKTRLFTYALNISIAYKYEKSWRARIDGSIISNNPTGFQGTSNGMVTSTLGLSKEFFDGKLMFDFSINNLFSKYRDNKTFTKGFDFYQVYSGRNYFRVFNVTMDYNFGGLKENIKKNKRTIRNNDLSNGRGM